MASRTLDPMNGQLMTSASTFRPVALVREPSPRLADGLVTDILPTMVETTETSLGSRLVPEPRAAGNV